MREHMGQQPPVLPQPFAAALQQGAHGRAEIVDPYGFAPTIGDFDLHLFNEGRLLEAWRMLGAVPMSLAGVAGVRFAVWAPNAERVSVVGDFNGWDGRAHPLEVRGASGVWELFVPGAAHGHRPCPPPFVEWAVVHRSAMPNRCTTAHSSSWSVATSSS